MRSKYRLPAFYAICHTIHNAAAKFNAFAGCANDHFITGVLALICHSLTETVNSLILRDSVELNHPTSTKLIILRSGVEFAAVKSKTDPQTPRRQISGFGADAML